MADSYTMWLCASNLRIYWEMIFITLYCNVKITQPRWSQAKAKVTLKVAIILMPHNVSRDFTEPGLLFLRPQYEGHLQGAQSCAMRQRLPANSLQQHKYLVIKKLYIARCTAADLKRSATREL